MSSILASLEKAFVGIDPNDTDTVKMGDAVFTARVLPSGLWDILTAGEVKLMRDTERAAIGRLAAEGKDPMEKAFPEDPKSSVTLLDIEASSDKEVLLRRTTQQLEVIRFGLVSHAGFCTSRGPVPFETEKAMVGGVEFDAVTPKILAYYGVNKFLRESVYLCILKLNTIGDTAKKA